eukprot:339639-Rhodomonas_salina.1
MGIKLTEARQKFVHMKVPSRPSLSCHARAHDPGRGHRAAVRCEQEANCNPLRCSICCGRMLWRGGG